MSNTTIKGIALHDGVNAVIKDNDCTKESNLVPMPLYTQDADETDVFDFGGATKLITLSGVYMNTTVALIKTWIDSIEALVQGQQDTEQGYPLTFIDDLRGTLKVKVISFNSDWREAEPTIASWSIKLIQSSTNS